MDMESMTPDDLSSKETIWWMGTMYQNDIPILRTA